MREKQELVQKHLTNIGNDLAEIMPENWTQVIYGYFLTGEDRTPHQQIFVRVNGAYEDWYAEHWDDERYDDAIFALSDESEALHRLCASSSDDWCSFTFVMDRNGVFSTDWGYKMIPRIDSYFVVQWKNKYLE